MRKVEMQDRTELAQVSKPENAQMTAAGPGTVGDKTTLLKLKVKPPVFSGKSREFAVFKRDFDTIVAVVGRNDVEVGALLKDSLPQGWRYILDKVNLANHREMMEILMPKFGRARVIVDECTAEIRNMRIITNK